MAECSDALAVRAERSRDHLSELVDRLQDQITPAELVSQLVGRRRSTSTHGPSIAETLTQQLRRNPIACALIAAGVGWLIMSEKAERDRSAPRRPIGRRRPAAVKRRTRRKNPA